MDVIPCHEGGCLRRRIHPVHRIRNGHKPYRNRLRAVHRRRRHTAGRPSPTPFARSPTSVFQSMPTDPVQKLILQWLSDLERRHAGYELRGVRGWTTPKEVTAALNRRLTDDLVRLADRKLVDRENIALPGRASAVWLYRISARGAQVTGLQEPIELGPPEASPPPHMIMTESEWAALQFMRGAKDQPSPARFTSRELGWRTLKEIRDGASVRSRDLQIWPEDVQHLERAGLLDKRNEPGVARARPLTFYRVTEIGGRVERLDRHAPEPPDGA
jgi:hypothetical protein